MTLQQLIWLGSSNSGPLDAGNNVLVAIEQTNSLESQKVLFQLFSPSNAPDLIISDIFFSASSFSEHFRVPLAEVSPLLSAFVPCSQIAVAEHPSDLQFFQRVFEVLKCQGMQLASRYFSQIPRATTEVHIPKCLF